MEDAKKKGRMTLGTRKVSDFSVERQTGNRCLRIQNYGFVPTRFPLLPGKPRRPSTPSLP